jgi:hypothetical protein
MAWESAFTKDNKILSSSIVVFFSVRSSENYKVHSQ